MPFVFGGLRPEPPAPAAVVRFWVPGKVTIVELSDFQCPFCRILHPSLTEAIKSYGDKVRLIRLSVPLRSHPQAKIAAKAYACAKQMGHGEKMAHELFDTKDRSKEGCWAAADKAELNPDRFASCFDTEEGTEAMMRDVEVARAITFKGLPTLWIGSKELIGASSSDELRDVIDEQLTGAAVQPLSIDQGWMWELVSIILAGLFGATAIAEAKERNA